MTEPSGGFDVGTAFVQLVLSLRGVQKDAAAAGAEAGKTFVVAFDDEVKRKSTPLPVPGKPESRKQGTESGGAFADAFTNRVKAALKSLPKARVGVDATEADAELQRIRERLAALGDVRVGVDLSAAEATAELDRLKARLDELGASSSDVQVRADTAKASEQLAAVQAQVDRLDGSRAEVKVDADTSSAESRISRLVSSSGAQRIRLGFDAPDPSALLPFGNALLSVGGAAAVASPLLFALGSSALQASAALAAGIPAAGGFAFSIGTIVAAVSGPLGALKKYEAAQKSAATATQTSAAVQGRSAAQIALTELSNARAIQSAQDSIASARERQGQVAADVADRIRSAQERVADAERTVVSAQEDAKRAQEALNDARRQAKQDLQDLMDQLHGFALDEEGARIALLRAEESAAKIARTKGHTALDEREAAFQVAEAQDRLTRVQKDAAKTADELHAAQKAGVKGAAGVVAAQRNIADANERVKSAQRGQVDAERNLARARTDGAQQQADAAKAVAVAVRNLSDVQKQQALQARITAEQETKSAKATGGASAAAKAYADSLKKLTPQGRTFLKTLLSYGPVIDRLKAAAETATLPGLTRFLNDVKGLGPLAARGITLFGKAIGDSAADLGRYAASPLFKRDFASLLDSTSKSTRNLGAAVTPLASSITTLAVASSPLLERFTAFILRGAKLADVFLRNKQATGELGSFFKRAGDEMAVWGGIVGNFGKGLLNLFKAANPAGDTLARRLLSISRSFADWTAQGDTAGKIRSFFDFFAHLDYKHLASIALAAGKLYLTYSGFKTAGEISKNPFFFLLALEAIKDPGAVSGFVDDVWHAAKPMLDFLAGHPNVFEGFIAFLGALRLAAAAKGVGGMLKGIPGLGKVLGGAGSLGGTPARPMYVYVVNNGIGGAPGAGGKGGGIASKIAGGLSLVTLAGTIAVVSSAIVDKLNGSQAAPLSGQGLKDATIHSPAAVGWKGILGNFLTGKPPSIPTAGLLGAFSGVRTFFTATLPGWGKAGFAASVGTFLHPTEVAPAGLGAAFSPVKSFFTSTAPSWAKTGFAVSRATFEHPLAIPTAGLGSAFSPVKSFFTATAPGWARTGLATGLAVYEHPRSIATAGLGAAFDGVKTFFTSQIPQFAKTGLTAVQTVWNQLPAALRGPVQSVLTNVLGPVVKAYDFLAEKFGGKAIGGAFLNTFSVPKNPGGANPTTAPGRGRAFATGGPVFGAGTATSDSIPALLSNGEHVLTAREVVAMGGHGAVLAMRRAALGGGALPGFASGGIVGALKSAADWGRGGIRSLQQASELGLRQAVSFLLAGLPGTFGKLHGEFSTSVVRGMVGSLIGDLFAKADSIPQAGDPSGGGGGGTVNIPANVSARIAAIQSFLRSTDPLPYIWGGTGPNGYDCSGIASAVYGMLTGRGGGHGQRYFTTSSNFEAAGFRRGTGSDFVIGVNPGTHMDGRLAGLPFEAQSTATGIHIGASATPTSRFAVQYYLPGISATSGSKSAPVHAFDSGGYLPPGLSLALNASGKPEPVFTDAQHRALLDANAGRGRAAAQITNNVANYGQPITAADVTRAQRQAEALLPIG